MGITTRSMAKKVRLTSSQRDTSTMMKHYLKAFKQNQENRGISEGYIMVGYMADQPSSPGKGFLKNAALRPTNSCV